MLVLLLRTEILSGNITVELYSGNSVPYGRTFGYWTQEWWKWVVSTPRSINPVLDETGANWQINQPSSDVFFLAGTFGDLQKHYAQRKVKMPKGRAILLPILNCEANSLEYPELLTANDLLSHVRKDIDSIVKKECLVNKLKLDPVRVASDPRIFPLEIPMDNVLDVKGGKVVDATADGYWIFMKPLPIGTYEVNFEGSCEFGRLSAGANYHITIV